MIDILIPFAAAVCFFSVASIMQSGNAHWLLVGFAMMFGAGMVVMGFDVLR